MSAPDEAIKAADPTTSVERLLELIGEHSERVLLNPTFALYLLERPNLWARLPDGAQGRLAQRPWCPAAFVEWALRAPEVESGYALSSMRHNAAIPAALRRRIFMQIGVGHEPWEELRPRLAEILSNQELSLLERASSRSVDGAPDLSLTGAELEQLCTLGSEGMTFAARHPNASEALLDRLCAMPGSQAPYALRHPNASPATLDKVLADPSSRSWAVVCNPKLTADQARVAARHPHREVRATLAERGDLPLDVQFVLAADLETLVFQTLRANLALAPKVRARLK